MSPTSLILDGIAVARLTRLVVKDTFPPVEAARRWWLARHPLPGRRLDESLWAPVNDERTVWARGDRYVNVVMVPAVEGTVPTLTAENDPDPLGELITCAWCSSVWLGAGVVVLRRYAPRFWDPVARFLTYSAVAGTFGTHT